ncbi:MAG TPA: penicillin-binding protein activator [Hyphomicrobiales bacterium]|nr:penicillin-binding protein activator [Hyphomicrobiales bacterium]
MQRTTRRFLLRSAMAAAGLLALAGCTSFGDTGVGGGTVAAAAPPTAAPPPGDVIGQGPVKVALILPLGASGTTAAVGRSMRNAAQLAVAEFNNPQIQVMVEDDQATPQGGQAAAQQAVQQGASLILGPVFAASVAAAGQVARPANIPIIAFSTDANVARPGVYLLSFLPKSDVDRMVTYAASRGRHSFVALLPEGAYGTVVGGALQQAVPQAGGRVVAIERYDARDRASMQAAVQRIAGAAKEADAIFLPDAGDTVPTLVGMLNAAGVDTHRALVMGTGQWNNDPRITTAPVMAGAVFPAPDAAGFQAFSQRYQAKFGSAPVRTATLAYDAVLLAAALTQTQQGPDRFSQGILTNPSGFQGIDGIFRFRADGTNERGLAVMQVGHGGAQVVSPAPRSFAGAPGL